MSAYAARYIKPNDRLTSFERLEIYNRQYWFRVLGRMAEDFPGPRATLGQRRFEDMCRAYLAECPARSFTLRNLGARAQAALNRPDFDAVYVPHPYKTKPSRRLRLGRTLLFSRLSLD